MSGCIFCRILAGELPAAQVYRDEHCIAIMDAYPLRPGHVLVISRTHAPLMTDLAPGERTQIIQTGSRIAMAIRAAYPGHDINWVVNDGKRAGQHVPHVHLHLIPRRRGDFAVMAASFAQRPFTMRRKPDISRLEAEAGRLRSYLQ